MTEARRAWPVAAVAIAVIVAGSGLLVLRSLSRAPGEALEKGRELASEMRRVAEAFRTGTLLTRFASEATRLNGTARLQFAELLQTELFERTDATSLFWGQLQLPDVVVEARAPVTYTYFVDFDKAWSFRLEGALLEATAPAIEFNTPAVDPSAIRYVVRQGSLLRDEAQALERLKAGLTELSRARARDHVPLVRDTGRRTIGEFVERWLRQGFEDGAAHRVRVRFADEPPQAPPGLERPAL
ncbi:MAG TPA: hypothetical protein VFM88_10155 [Vicinamibacteria bacterium]|nr:hypothetical protein [Vicinamibacteria bacterium]